MCFVVLYPFSACAEAHFELPPHPVFSHSVFFIYPTMHSVIISGHPVGGALSWVLGMETQLHSCLLQFSQRAYLKPVLTNVMSVSKPRMLREQITGKPNLIWEAREGLPKEVTTKLRPEG